jgi:putative restriction endonuclease
LITPAGPYAEAAHIRALGTPHNGPDVLENLLCLCPNDHVRFDARAIYVDDNLEVREFVDGASSGSLRLRPGHTPNHDYFTYHGDHFAKPVNTSRMPAS